MLGFTHWYIGYKFWKKYLKHNLNILVYFLILGSIFPDIDFLFWHRSPLTHNLFFFFLLILIYFLFKKTNNKIFLYLSFFIIWIILHLILDILVWPVYFLNIKVYLFNLKDLNLLITSLVDFILFYYFIDKDLEKLLFKNNYIIIFLILLFFLDIFYIISK